MIEVIGNIKENRNREIVKRDFKYFLIFFFGPYSLEKGKYFTAFSWQAIGSCKIPNIRFEVDLDFRTLQTYLTDGILNYSVVHGVIQIVPYEYLNFSNNTVVTLPYEWLNGTISLPLN